MADIAQIGFAVDTTGLQRAERGLESLEQKQNRATTAGQKMTLQTQRLTRGLFNLRTAIAGLGVGLVFRQIIREFSEFERRLVEVGKVADLEGRQLDLLGRRIQEIARGVPVSTNRLQSLAVAAGQLGVTGVDNLAAFTETLGRLELATDIAGEQGARSLARLLNITGRSESEISNLGSAITALGNQFATTEQEIARTSTFLAPATTQFDVSAESVLGLSAALRAMGQRAETSGSAVGAAMGSMVTAIAEGGSTLRTLAELTNQTTAAFAASFEQDATQALLDFAEGLNELPAAQQIGVLEDLGLAGRETSRVINALAADVDEARRAVRISNDSWEENIALLKESARATDTFSGQMQLVINAVDEAAVEIGRELAPAILDATTQLRDFIIEARDAGEIAAVAREVGGAFEFLAENMEGVTVAGTTLLGLNIGAKFGPIGAIIGTFAGALGGLVLVLDETTEAERLYNEVIRETTKAINDGEQSGVEMIQRRLDQAKTALAAAEAEAQLEAVLNRTAGSMGQASEASRQRVEVLREQISALGQQLLILEGSLGSLEGFGAAEVLRGGDTGEDPKTRPGGDGDMEAKKRVERITEAITDMNREAAQAQALMSELQIGDAESVRRLEAMQDLARQGRQLEIGEVSPELQEQFREAGLANIEASLALDDARDSFDAFNAAADQTGSLERRNDQLRALIVAAGQGRAAVDELSREQEAQNAVIEAGIPLNTAHGDALFRAALANAELRDEAIETNRALREQERLARRSADALTTAFSDAIIEGKSLNDVMENLLRTFQRLLLEVTLNQPLRDAFRGETEGGPFDPLKTFLSGITGNLFGGGGGFNAPIVGAGSSAAGSFIADTSFLLPGFQHGAEGVPVDRLSVGNLSGPDNRLVAFRARSDETVDVNRRGESGRVTVINNITTPDADSFRRSEGQIATRTANVLRRQEARR